MHSHPEPSPISFLSNNTSGTNQQQHENEIEENEDVQKRFHQLSPSVQHQRLTISQMKEAVAMEHQQHQNHYSIFSNNNNNKTNNQNQNVQDNELL